MPPTNAESATKIGPAMLESIVHCGHSTGFRPRICTDHHGSALDKNLARILITAVP